MTWRIAPTAFGLAAIRARTRLLRSTWRVSLRSVLRFLGVRHHADAALRARPLGRRRVGVVAGRAVADRVGPGAAAGEAPGGVGAGDREQLAVAGDVDVGRVPRRRDEADALAVDEVEHRERVLPAERDVEPLAVGRDRQPVGHRAGAHAVGEPDRHRADHALVLRVDDRDRVGVAVGGVDLVAARVGGDRVGVVGELRAVRRREQDPPPHALGPRVDHRHRAAHPVRHVRPAPAAAEGDAVGLLRGPEVDRLDHVVGLRVDHRDRAAGRVGGAGDAGEVVGDVDAVAPGRVAVGEAGREVRRRDLAGLLQRLADVVDVDDVLAAA